MEPGYRHHDAPLPAASKMLTILFLQDSCLRWLLLSSRLGVRKRCLCMLFSFNPKSHKYKGSRYLPQMPKSCWSVVYIWCTYFCVCILCVCVWLVCTVSEQVSSNISPTSKFNSPTSSTHPHLLQVFFFLSELVLGVFRWSVEVIQLHPTWISHLHQGRLHILTFTILPASIPGAMQPKNTLNMCWFRETSSQKKIT